MQSCITKNVIYLFVIKIPKVLKVSLDNPNAWVNV